MTESFKQIAIAVVHCEDLVLVGQRPAGTSLAGYSEFPGGKVEHGETLEAAAVRECLEETGLAITIEGQYPDKRFEYEHATVHLHFFRCRLKSAAEQKSPAGAFRWIPTNELLALRFPDANQELIQLLTT